MTNESLFLLAHTAAHKAAQECVPTPMVVGSPSTLLGNDVDPTQQTWYVEGGVCGFAWVVVRDGRSSFARYLSKEKDCNRHYYGGTQLWVGDYGQSMARKEAYAAEFARVLNINGVKAYSGSRMD